MHDDNSFAGDHVAIWSSVVLTQRGRLPFHNFQLHAGNLNTAFTK